MSCQQQSKAAHISSVEKEYTKDTLSKKIVYIENRELVSKGRSLPPPRKSTFYIKYSFTYEFSFISASVRRKLKWKNLYTNMSSWCWRENFSRYTICMWFNFLSLDLHSLVVGYIEGNEKEIFFFILKRKFDDENLYIWFEAMRVMDKRGMMKKRERAIDFLCSAKFHKFTTRELTTWFPSLLPNQSSFPIFCNIP